jgi:hypothetical protein
MIRVIAKIFAVTVALTAFLHVAPVFAAEPQPVIWISSTGSDSNPCTAALPCATFNTASGGLTAGGQISCLDFPGPIGASLEVTTSLTIDCAGVYVVNFPNLGAFQLQATDQVVKIRNLTISGAAGGYPAIKVTGGGTLVLENCVLDNLPGTALDIEPTGPFNLVIKNTRISNSSAGILIKPQAGGSVTATFDGVTIDGNSGGGLKTDTTNGSITVDISNGTISNNAGNGMNAVSGAGGANMLNIHNSVIAKNGSAGVQANGANAAALIDTTLLDSNVAGALSAVGGGRVLTYGNNRIVGSSGTGFTGSAALQ